MSAIPFEQRPKVWREWKDLAGPDIDALPRDRTIVLVSVSPLEVHGPHLPVLCDNIEAEGLSHRTAEVLLERRPDLVFVHLPPLYVAADVLPHVGSVMYRSSTVRRVVEDLGRSLVKQGFKRIWVSNFHGGPRHFVPIEQACDRVNRKYGGAMVSTFGLLLNKLTGGSTSLDAVLGPSAGFDPRLLVGDSHGGAVETSMLLHLVGDRVKPGFASLPRRTVDLKLQEQQRPPIETPGKRPSLAQLVRGFKHKLKYYEDETYSGSPSVASAEAGAKFVDILGTHAADALEEVLDGKRRTDQCYSPLWKARWVFSAEWLTRGFELAVSYKQRVF